MGGKKKSKSKGKKGPGPKPSAGASSSAAAQKTPPAKAGEITHLLDLLAADKCTPVQKGRIQDLYREDDDDLFFKRQLFEREAKHFFVSDEVEEMLNIRKMIGFLEFGNSTFLVPEGFRSSTTLPKRRPEREKFPELTARQNELLRDVPMRYCNESDDLEFEECYTNVPGFKEAVFRREAEMLAAKDYEQVRALREYIGYTEFGDVLVMISEHEKEGAARLHDIYTIAEEKALPDVTPEKVRLIVCDLWESDLSCEEAARLAGGGPRKPYQGFTSLLALGYCREGRYYTQPTRFGSQNSEGPPSGPARTHLSPARRNTGERPAQPGRASSALRGSERGSPSSALTHLSPARRNAGEGPAQPGRASSASRDSERGNPGSALTHLSPARRNAGEGPAQPGRASSAPRGSERGSPGPARQSTVEGSSPQRRTSSVPRSSTDKRASPVRRGSEEGSAQTQRSSAPRRNAGERAAEIQGGSSSHQGRAVERAEPARITPSPSQQHARTSQVVQRSGEEGSHQARNSPPPRATRGSGESGA